MAAAGEAVTDPDLKRPRALSNPDLARTGRDWATGRWFQNTPSTFVTEPIGEHRQTCQHLSLLAGLHLHGNKHGRQRVDSRRNCEEPQQCASE
nr:cortexin-2 isoform X1 [Pongo abelii]